MSIEFLLSAALWQSTRESSALREEVEDLRGDVRRLSGDLRRERRRSGKCCAWCGAGGDLFRREVPGDFDDIDVVMLCRSCDRVEI